jgi:chromosome segregation ATPase
MSEIHNRGSVHRLGRVGQVRASLDKSLRAAEPRLEGDQTELRSSPVARGSSFKDQILALDGRRRDTRDRIDAVAGQLAKAQQIQERLEQEIEAKRRDLAELERRGAGLEDAKARLEADLDHDLRKLEGLEQRVRDLKAEAKALAAQGNELAEAHREAFVKARTAKAYYDYLKGLDPRTLPDGALQRAEREWRSAEAAAAEKGLKTGESDIARNRDARDGNARATSRAERDVTSQQGIVARIGEAVAKARADLLGVRQKAGELEQRTRAQEQEASANLDEIRAARGKIDDLGRSLDRLTQERNTLLERALDADQRTLAKIRREEQTLAAETERVKDAIRAAQDVFERAMARRDALKGEQAELARQLAELQAELRRLGEERGHTQGEISGAKESVARAADAIRRLEGNDQTLVQRGNDLSDTRFDLLREQAGLDRLSQLDPDQLSERDRRRLARRPELESRIADLTGRILDLNGKRQDVAREIDSQEQRIAEAKQRIAGAQRRLARIEQTIDKDSATASRAREELRAAEDELRSASEGARKALAAQDKLQGDLEDIGREQRQLLGAREQVLREIQDLLSLRE